MPEEEILDEYGFPLESIVLDGFQKGHIIKNMRTDEEEEFIHYEIRNIRALAKDIYKLYSNPKSTNPSIVRLCLFIIKSDLRIPHSEFGKL